MCINQVHENVKAYAIQQLHLMLTCLDIEQLKCCPRQICPMTQQQVI